MVSRTFVRTPRKEKIWAYSDLISDAIASSTRGVAGDLLSAWRTDAGVSQTVRVTVMRIIGHIRLYELGAATTPTTCKLRWGLAWLPKQIIDASDGDAQLPDVGSPTNEAIWLQTGILFGDEVASLTTVAGASLSPIETAFQRLDITQMRKQPTSDHELGLVWDTPSGVETNTVGLELEVRTMLALP